MKVLVAEDDAASRRLLEKLLANAGHDVVSTTNGAEAIEAFNSDSDIQMALLDWMMPGIDGLQVVAQIRKAKKRGRKHCYVIMVSAKSAKEDIMEALECGVDDFVSKPYDANILLARVNVGKRHLKELVAKEPPERFDPLYTIQNEHENLLAMTRIFDALQSKVEKGVPKEIFTWASSTASLLTLEVHLAKETHYMNQFLLNVMTEQGEWFRDISESSFGIIQEEHEGMIELLGNIQAALNLYFERKQEALAPIVRSLNYFNILSQIEENDEEVERLIDDIREKVDAYVGIRDKAVMELKEAIVAYTRLVEIHIKREEAIFYPFTLKYLSKDDMAELEELFEEVDREVGQERLAKEVEKLKRMTRSLKK